MSKPPAKPVVLIVGKVRCEILLGREAIESISRVFLMKLLGAKQLQIMRVFILYV